MKKRALVAMLVSAAMACTLFVGCSTPTKETPSDSGSKTESNDSKSSSSSERASATVVDTDKLPIKGIGAEVSTDVKADKEYKIGYISKNTTNPYMIAQAEGVKKAGEDMGFKAVTQAPSTADSVEEQVKIMEDMIQQDMDVIIVHCADSNGIMPGVRKAEEAGISVITIGTPASEDTFLRTGVDYKETGKTIATEMAETLNGKGNVIILEGPPGAANAGMSVTENLIQKYTDVQGVIGCNDESALGAVQALKAAGMNDVLVAGFDGSVDATNAVESGEMFATYNTDPYGSGYIACAYAVKYLNDGTEPEGKFIPFPTAANDPLITSESVANYKENIAWWKVIQ